MTDSSHSRITYCLLLLASITKCLSALHLLKLDVPGIVSHGIPTLLGCNFDLVNDSLYSVKWYKNRVEFYRYLPSDKPPGQKYDLDGVHVDLEQSNGSHVYLKDTDYTTEGLYMCEISGDAPSFQTITAEKDLHVYQMPEGGPQIQGLDAIYQAGDFLNVSCSTSPSKPRAKLKWTINEKLVPEGFEKHFPDKIEHGGYLRSSEVALYMALGPVHFPRGTLRLACTASMEQLDTSSSKELVIPDTNQYKSPQQLTHSSNGHNSPTIVGEKNRYNLGDHIDVNCTSSNSSAPTKLKWKLNEKQVEESDLVKYPMTYDINGWEIAVLGLRLKLKQEHFKNQEVRLLCVATTYNIVQMRSEAKVVGFNEMNSDLHVSEVASMEVQGGSSGRLLIANIFLVFCLAASQLLN